MLRDLFRHYLRRPNEIGEQSRKRKRKVGVHRAIGEYLAGMTDRYVIQEHQRIFTPRPG
jgi:dGTPase